MTVVSSNGLARIGVQVQMPLCKCHIFKAGMRERRIG